MPSTHIVVATIPRTTPVVREKVLNEYQGLRSFYSLNPWLFSLTPPAWQKVAAKFPVDGFALDRVPFPTCCSRLPSPRNP